MPPVSTSPCKKLCALTPDRSQCVSCGRLLSEISSWRQLTDSQRAAVSIAAAARLSKPHLGAAGEEDR